MGSASTAVSPNPRQPRPDAFRGVAGQLVTGVSVVVTLVAGEPFATTAGSLVAASWDPPLLAVFFQTGSQMSKALDDAGRFTVNVLGEADHGLARRFARPDREHGWAAFSGIHLQRRDPSPPRLSNAVAWADCTVAHVIPIGDHRCYVGEVLDSTRHGGAPLTYYRGRFRALGPALTPATWLDLDLSDLTMTW
jgi:flavin reductase (DIM6/NTAB) family NADH-FMN oxidoreductase RutF